MIYQLHEIVDNGTIYSNRLKKAGVANTNDLLKKAGFRYGRKRLARLTGIKENKLLELVQNADLLRVKGIGSQYANLLLEANVRSIESLADCHANTLQRQLQAINEEQKMVNHLPTLEQLQDFIEQAQELPILVKATSVRQDWQLVWEKYGLIGIIVLSFISLITLLFLGYHLKQTVKKL